MTAKASVIGWPVEHSLSPLLHGHWLKTYGIDGSYEKIAAAPDQFEATIRDLRQRGFRGVNVTVPHKEAAFALADTNDAAARATGAINLLAFRKSGIEGRNTDAFGLAESLRETIGTLQNETVVLLGAGGAARGAAYGLHAFGHAAKITILNRNKARADQLVAHLQTQTPGAKFATGTLDDWPAAAADARLLVNTTSAGMNGNPPLDIDLGALNQSAAVCDIVYSPLETPLLKDARARGHQTIDGLGMLMHQAAPSFQAFFYEEMQGRMPEVTPELRAVLVKALQDRG